VAERETIKQQMPEQSAARWRNPVLLEFMEFTLVQFMVVKRKMLAITSAVHQVPRREEVDDFMAVVFGGSGVCSGGTASGFRIASLDGRSGAPGGR
jgi:hypothetical protein